MRLRNIVEEFDEYAGLDDEDEFTTNWSTNTCDFCYKQYESENGEPYKCVNCDSRVCPQCELSSSRVAGLNIFCSYGCQHEWAETQQRLSEDIDEYDEYAGLDDEDEFTEEDSDLATCVGCNRQSDTGGLCSGCDDYYCDNCVAILMDIVGGAGSTIKCRSCLRSDTGMDTINSYDLNESSPVIRRVMWNPASIVIEFPGGEVWEYRVGENRWLQDILRRHGRNAGRVVAALKRLDIRSKRLSSSKNNY